MNRLIAAFVILALALGTGLTGYFYISLSSRSMIEQLENDRLLTVESRIMSEERAENIQKEWEKREPFFVAILPHEELDDVEINIMSLTDYCSQGLTDEYIKALNECINRLEHICESEKPGFKNVF